MNRLNLLLRPHLVGQLSAVIALLVSPIALAENNQAEFSRIKAEVKATPPKAGAILKRELRSLKGNDRVALASGILDAVYDGLAESPAYQGKNNRPTCDDVEKLFRIALAEAPEAAPSLLAVAIKACPSRRALLTRLAITLLPPGLADSLLEAILAVFGGASGEGAIVLAPGTINPANIGGAPPPLAPGEGEVVSPAE